MNSEKISITSVKLPNLMRYFLFYLCSTVFLCFFGPIHFNLRNPWLLLLYLTLYHIALWLGYKVATKNDIRKYPYLEKAEFGNNDSRFMSVIIIVGIVVALMLLVLVCGTANPVDIISKVIEGIVSPSVRYDHAFEESMLRGSGIASFIITLGMPFTIMALILSIFFFSRLSVLYKILTFVLYFVHLCYCLTQGANEGIFDVAIYIGVTLFLKIQSKKADSHRPRMDKKMKIILVVAVAALVIIALSFFTNNIIGRTQANFAFGTLGENYYDKDAFINRFVPKGLFVTFVYLTVYLCEGYYGMSLATTLDWVPNWGMGFSPFIRNNFSDLLGIDLFQNSYQVRIGENYEWGALRNFHTAYTFWANDVSFVGVILIMFILGYVFCKCYRASVLRQSKSAIVMMPLLVTMLFYLPANNKVFVQPASMLLMIYLAVYELLKGFSKKEVLKK